MNTRQFVTNTPMLKLFVLKSFLTQNPVDIDTFIECYMVSVKSVYGRPLLFTVYTEDCALYSGLPINCLYVSQSDKKLSLNTAQPFSCISDKIQIIKYEFMKDMEAECYLSSKTEQGTYLFTIEYYDDGLAEDPEQFKTHNIIALDNGPLVALPNNKCLFNDGFFGENSNVMPNYKRNSTYWKGPK